MAGFSITLRCTSRAFLIARGVRKWQQGRPQEGGGCRPAGSPCDRPPAGVARVCPGPPGCLPAARGAQLGKEIGLRKKGCVWATRAEAPLIYWALLIPQAVLTVVFLFIMLRLFGKVWLLLVVDLCRRQCVLAAHRVAKLRCHR